jgi:hypothetical protein
MCWSTIVDSTRSNEFEVRGRVVESLITNEFVDVFHQFCDFGFARLEELFFLPAAAALIGTA